MTRRSGSFITETPSLPTTSSGGGIWPIMEASQNVGNGRWPYYFPPSAYTINNSLRFRSSASAYLSRTPSAAGSQTTWTWSGWVKRGDITTTVQMIFGAYSTSAGAISLYFANQMLQLGNNAGTIGIQTNAIYRDPSAWYHIVVVLNTTSATSSNRLMIYVNGVQMSVQNATYPSQNATYDVNASGVPHNIFRQASTGSYPCDGYLAEVNFIDGLALDPSYFGATNTTTGTWSPKQYTGSYGTNGFYLKFNNTASTTTLGYDSSGNGNNWTTNNISLTAGSTYDAMLDVPTPVSATVGNYCVLNNIGSSTVGVNTFSDGNLAVQQDRSSSNPFLKGTMAVNSGKWYWEVKVTSSNIYAYIGVVDVTLSQSTATTFLGLSSTPVRAWNLGDGTLENGNLYPSRPSYGTGGAQNDTVGVALDLDNGKIYFSKNGTWQGSGDPVAGTNAAFTNLVTSGYTWTPFAAINSATLWNGVFNFGQRPFTYTPPTGFKALNTYNLSEPTILKGNQYFDATTYTGTGSSQSIINSGTFRPDFIWIKSRSNARDHRNMDSVRGINNVLTPNSTAAEYAGSALSSIDNIGFTLNTTDNQNVSAETYVAWQWKAGGTAVTNTSGSISSQVSANPTNGFSVVTYTGTGANATVGHGLGVAPAFIIVSARNTTHDWCAYHQSIGNTSAIFPNLTNASSASIYYWNNTSPSSSVFSIGIAGGVNNSSSTTYVAYCFAAIQGYSAFGSYTGNGSSDGVFIHLGFKPRFILTKCTSGTSDWIILDTSRDTYNVSGLCLEANLSVAESTNGGAYSSQTDILSNGFKIRNSGSGANGSGQTYIYAAFAESPFKYSLGR